MQQRILALLYQSALHAAGKSPIPHCPHCGYTEITNSKLSRYRKYDLVQKVLTGFGLVIGVLGVIGVILSGVQLSGTVETSVLIAAIISSAVDALYPALILIGLGTILGAAWEDK